MYGIYTSYHRLTLYICLNALWWLIAVPGDPQDVRATYINSTAIRVQWRPPLEKDRNGIIRGYHVHVQETKEEVCTIDIMLENLAYDLFELPEAKTSQFQFSVTSHYFS